MSEPTPVGRNIGARIAVLVVAGVSGSGKSTIGEGLAQALGWPYSDADAFHSQANIVKMSSGAALTDADRIPWLAAIAAFIADVCVRGEHAIVSCSALKRAYRETLVGNRRDRVKIVLLDGMEDEIGARLAQRKGHFMPPELLHSQFAALERPTADEGVIVVPIGGTPDETIKRTVANLQG